MLNLAHVRRGALALSLAATLAAAPAALASGGSSGGGSGGGGGGAGGGSTTTTTSSSSCAKITSFGNISGYAWGSGTEIDTPYTVASSCTGPTTVDVTYTDQLTASSTSSAASRWRPTPPTAARSSTRPVRTPRPTR